MRIIIVLAILSTISLGRILRLITTLIAAALFAAQANAGTFHSTEIPGLIMWIPFNSSYVGNASGNTNFTEDFSGAVINGRGSYSVALNGGLSTTVTNPVPFAAGILGTGSANTLGGAGANTSYITTNSFVWPQTGATFTQWLKSKNTDAGSLWGIDNTSAGNITMTSMYANAQLTGNGGVVFYLVTGAATAYVARQTPAAQFASTNIWKHVACVWDGGLTAASLKIFINGVRADSTSITVGIIAIPNSSSLYMKIATINAGNNVNTIPTPQLSSTTFYDDFRVYNRALTVDEIQLLYGAGYGSQH